MNEVVTNKGRPNPFHQEIHDTFEYGNSLLGIENEAMLPICPEDVHQLQEKVKRLTSQVQCLTAELSHYQRAKLTPECEIKPDILDKISLVAKHRTKQQQRQEKLVNKLEDLECKHRKYEAETSEVVKVKDIQIRLMTQEIQELSQRLTQSDNCSCGASRTTEKLAAAVAAHYQTFIKHQWRKAKSCIDQQLLSDSSEEVKLQLLTQILLIAEVKAKGCHKRLQQKVMICLEEPLIKQQGETCRQDTTEVDRTRDHCQIDENHNNETPTDRKCHDDIVTVAMDDYLRPRAGSVRFDVLQEEIIEEINRQNENNESKHFSEWKTLQTHKHIQEYILRSAELTWQMVLQCPPMRFSTEEVGRPWEARSDIVVHWESDKPEHPLCKVACYSYPALYHGDRLMVKGEVLLKVTKKTL